MFNEIEGMLSRFTGGNADPQAVQQAASEHVDGMSTDELSGHLQTAAGNLQQNGQGAVAQELIRIATGPHDAESLKTDAVAFIRDNPQVIAQFAPSFAQGILGKLGV